MKGGLIDIACDVQAETLVAGGLDSQFPELCGVFQRVAGIRIRKSCDVQPGSFEQGLAVDALFIERRLDRLGPAAE